MRTWTKTHANGKTVELAFNGHSIGVAVDGKKEFSVGDVVTLDAAARRGPYKNAPKATADGRPFTHAVGSILLGEKDAEQVLAIREFEISDCDRRVRAGLLERYSRQYAEAVTTGQPAEIDRWMEPRDNPACVVEFIHPDGSFSTRRIFAS